MKMKTWLKYALILCALQLALIATLMGVERARQRATAAPWLKQAPAQVKPLTLNARDGALTTLPKVTGQRPALVHFWASWCPPCIEELPGLIARQREGHQRVILISVDQSWEAALALVPDQAVELYLASADDAAASFGVKTLPMTYALDAQGRLIATQPLPQDWSQPQVWELASALLR